MSETFTVFGVRTGESRMSVHRDVEIEGVDVIGEGFRVYIKRSDGSVIGVPYKSVGFITDDNEEK